MYFDEFKVKQYIKGYDANTGIKVTYKEFVSNEFENVITRTCKAWSEDGNYTAFYDDVSLDSVAFLVPTHNVISIEVIRGSEDNKNILH